jgi:hypothetical protein
MSQKKRTITTVKTSKLAKHKKLPGLACEAMYRFVLCAVVVLSTLTNRPFKSPQKI